MCKRVQAHAGAQVSRVGTGGVGAVVEAAAQWAFGALVKCAPDAQRGVTVHSITAGEPGEMVDLSSSAMEGVRVEVGTCNYTGGLV